MLNWLTKCPDCHGKSRRLPEGEYPDCPTCQGDHKPRWLKRIRHRLSRPLLGFCPTCYYPDRFLGWWLDAVPLLGCAVKWVHGNCTEEIPF